MVSMVGFVVASIVLRMAVFAPAVSSDHVCHLWYSCPLGDNVRYPGRTRPCCCHLGKMTHGIGKVMINALYLGLVPLLGISS
jgi:hypothetical protein